MIGLLAGALLGSQQPLGPTAALEQLNAANEARGLDAAKQGMARGGYGFSMVGTPYGVEVLAVAPGSKAAAAGLKSGDDVVEVNGRSTVGFTTEQMIALIKSNPPGGFEMKISGGAPVHLPPLSIQVVGSTAIAPDTSTGCIGSPLLVCIAHMSRSVRVDMTEIATQLNRSAEMDVNGKPLGGSKFVTGTAFYGASQSPNIVTFERNDEGNVSSVELSLRGNPMIAKTEAEYAATGLGDAFKAILPTSCTAEGDLATYRFFENVVKPTIRMGEKTTTIDETHASSDRMSQSSAAAYCGVRVKFSHLGGYDTDNIDEYNDHGSYSFATINFSVADEAPAKHHTGVISK